MPVRISRQLLALILGVQSRGSRLRAPLVWLRSSWSDTLKGAVLGHCSGSEISSAQ